jgi:hypothetical protein
MAKFVVGDVVIVPFPFSDLTQTKRRPALVVAGLSGEDLILCQITRIFKLTILRLTYWALIFPKTSLH